MSFFSPMWQQDAAMFLLACLAALYKSIGKYRFVSFCLCKMQSQADNF